MTGEERDAMRRKTWSRALRSAAMLATLGVVLGGCGGLEPARYGRGGGYYGGGPGYYGSPYGSSYGSYGYGRYNDPYRYGSRGYGGYEGRRFSQPRFEGPSQQDRLRQHWIDQSRRAR
jgi:hypothetical protein